MKNNKIFFDLFFILLSAALLITLNQLALLEKYAGFALIPLLMAYFLGQYSERRYGKRKEN